MSLFSSSTPPDPAQPPASEQVAAPLFLGLKLSTPKVHLFCITPDAQIYFCQGDDRPVPGEPGTQLYVDPLDVPEAGLRLCAAAFREGMAPSPAVRAIIDVEFLPSQPEAVSPPVVIDFTSESFVDAAVKQLCDDVSAAGIPSETFGTVLREEGLAMAQRIRARLLPDEGSNS